MSHAGGVTPLAEDDDIRPMRFAALQVPTFRWYWVTSWISSTGDGMENVIRGLLVVQLVGIAAAPFWLGMMVFAHWVPFTLFSLYGGALADRYDNRKVQIAAQLLLMTAAFGVAAATLLGVVTVWWIFGLLLVHGFAGAIGGPAQQTLIHSIVGRDRLLSAVSLNSTARQLSQVIGPAVAGFIYLQFGPGWGLFVNGLTFVRLPGVLRAAGAEGGHRSAGGARRAARRPRVRPVETEDRRTHRGRDASGHFPGPHLQLVARGVRDGLPPRRDARLLVPARRERRRRAHRRDVDGVRPSAR